MSFFDDASLVMIPSGYKASKVYSVKPTDGTGDLTFSRASTATRVNASGLIASVASNVPRLDYTNSTCPKLLLEPQRTNLVLYSEAFNAVWTLNGITVTPDATTSPTGVASADKLIATAGAGAKYAFQILAVTNAVAYTTSTYFKAAEYTFAFMRLGGIDGNPYVIYNLATQAVVATSGLTSSTITSVGNGWYRVTVTATQTSIVLAPVVMVIPSTGYTLNGSNLPEFTGDGTSGGFVWGAQAEQGSYATSFIPTEGTAVTRVADACSKTGISSLIGQTEGTVFFEYPNFNSDFNSGLIGIDDGSGNNRILFYSDTNNRITAQVRTNGVSQQPASYSVSGDVKVAIAYDSTGFVFYVNGTLRFTGTAVVFSSTMSVLTYNHVGVGSSITNQALLFKTRLTNAQLAELTA
jgi:hypothetical protein